MFRFRTEPSPPPSFLRFGRGKKHCKNLNKSVASKNKTGPVLPKSSCKPLVCKPYKAKLCMAAKLLAAGACKPYKAKLCMAAKLLAEGGKTPFCKPYKAKLCMGGKTTFCKPYKAYKAKLCTSFVRRRTGRKRKLNKLFARPDVAAFLCISLYIRLVLSYKLLLLGKLVQVQSFGKQSKSSTVSCIHSCDKFLYIKTKNRVFIYL